MKAKAWGAAIMFILVAVAFTIAFSQSAPQLINYQGRLTTSTGELISGDTVDFTFRFYGTQASNTVCLTVLQEDVQVSNGIYHVLIGSGTVTPGTERDLAAVFKNHTEVWLGVQADGDAEMLPRFRIGSVPYALHARSFDEQVLADFLGTFLGATDWDHDGYPKIQSGSTPADCNDGNAAIHPGAPEICDGKDNQCPGDQGYGYVDEGCPGVCTDADGDGYFREAGCGTAPDCNDFDPNNWNACAACVDADHDTYYTGCNRYLTIFGPDCDDGYSLSHPGGTEVCDNRDNDCDGQVDEGSNLCPIRPHSNDYCSAGACLLSCIAPFENCDLNNVNGCEADTLTDEFNCGDCNYCCTGGDFCIVGACQHSCSDGGKNGAETDVDCGGPECPPCSTGKTCLTGPDCQSGICQAGLCEPITCVDNDLDSWYIGCSRYITINGPDCDDNGSSGGSCHDTCTNFYQDSDNDGFGNGLVSVSRCTAPSGYVANDDDCDDSDSSSYPGALETGCDGKDHNCDGFLSCYHSCYEIKLAQPATPDGIYIIDVDGAGSMAPFQVYCDMTTQGGGWTMVANFRNPSDYETYIFAGNNQVYGSGYPNPNSSTSWADWRVLYGQSWPEDFAIILDSAWPGWGDAKVIYRVKNRSIMPHYGVAHDLTTGDNLYYSLNFGSWLDVGSSSSSATISWQPYSNTNQPLIWFNAGGGKTNFYGAGITGGDNTWFHSSHMFIRNSQ